LSKGRGKTLREKKEGRFWCFEGQKQINLKTNYSSVKRTERIRKGDGGARKKKEKLMGGQRKGERRSTKNAGKRG